MTFHRARRLEPDQALPLQAQLPQITTVYMLRWGNFFPKPIPTNTWSMSASLLLCWLYWYTGLLQAHAFGYEIRVLDRTPERRYAGIPQSAIFCCDDHRGRFCCLAVCAPDGQFPYQVIATTSRIDQTGFDAIVLFARLNTAIGALFGSLLFGDCARQPAVQVTHLCDIVLILEPGSLLYCL